MNTRLNSRAAEVYVDQLRAGTLVEQERGRHYTFQYDQHYRGQPISLVMPVREAAYEFTTFPPFFDGLLPEGIQLEAMLRQRKIDKDDLFSQLLAVGQDLVGNVTVVEETKQ